MNHYPITSDEVAAQVADLNEAGKLDLADDLIEYHLDIGRADIEALERMRTKD